MSSDDPVVGLFGKGGVFLDGAMGKYLVRVNSLLRAAFRLKTYKSPSLDLPSPPPFIYNASSHFTSMSQSPKHLSTDSSQSSHHSYAYSLSRPHFCSHFCRCISHSHPCVFSCPPCRSPWCTHHSPGCKQSSACQCNLSVVISPRCLPLLTVFSNG